MKKINCLNNKYVEKYMSVILFLGVVTFYFSSEVGGLVFINGVRMSGRYYAYNGSCGLIQVSAFFWWSNYILQAITFVSVFVFFMCILYDGLCDKINNLR